MAGSEIGQLAMFVVTIVFATWVVAGSRRKRLAIPAVALFVVGANWKLLQIALMVAMWSVSR